MSLLSSLRGLFRRKQLDRDIDDELRFHLAMRADDNLRAGMSRDEARDAARRRFGSTTLLKEDTRRMDLVAWLESAAQDVRHGFRALLRSPAFTAAAVLSLALGIGGNTAIFSFVDAILLKSLPVARPSELVLFGPGTAEGNNGGFPDQNMDLFSYPMYQEIRDKNEVFSGVAAINSFSYSLHGTVGGGQNLEPLEVQLVSGTYFDVLGIPPAAGRLLAPTDDLTLGGHPVAVISYGWWMRRFSGDPAIVGKAVTIGTTAYTIVGVAPRGFFGTTLGDSLDMWVPLQKEEQISRGPHKLNDKFYQSLDLIARLKPGVNIARAQANINVVLNGILHEYAGEHPSQKRLQDIAKAHIGLQPAATGKPLLRDQFSAPLEILSAIVALVLLIACANLANLFLARATARRREMAVRSALGAGRARLIRQLLTECLVLAAAGGLLGAFLAMWAGEFLLKIIFRSSPLDLSLNLRVLAFTAGVSLATVVLFAVLPAVRATRFELLPSLSEGRSAATREGRTPLSKMLLVSQVALSLVLLLAAGLLVRSLVNLVNVRTGFDKQGVLMFRLDSTATGYKDKESLWNLYNAVEQRVEALPGVRAASFSIFTFNQGGWNDPALLEGFQGDPDAQPPTYYNAVGPDYFAALGLPILEGRAIAPSDSPTSLRVAVVNETLARQLFPGTSPLGKHFRMGGGSENNQYIEIVGVVRDAKYMTLDERPTAMAYYPYTQYLPSWGTGLYLRDFTVRFSGNSRDVVPAIRAAIAQTNPNLPVADVRTLTEQVDSSIVYPRLVAQLSSFFGILAAFLACVGIYGLTSYGVARRTSEIGIRMALGAQRSDVLRLVLGEAMLLVAVGLAIGIPTALASERWLRSFLFGLKPGDLTTIILATVGIAALAAVAAYLPARRAMRVDPVAALRYE